MDETGQENAPKLTHRNLAKRTHEKLIDQTERDPLTGLLNRKGLISRAIPAIEHAHRSNEPMAFFVTDLDELKKSTIFWVIPQAMRL